MNPVTVAEVRAHIAFLRAVHVSSSRGEGSLLADGTRLRAAVRAYIPWLAFHAARASNGRAVLVERAPPLDAAWIWHVHRLDSRDYARTCAAFGAFVAPAPGVGFAASDSVATPAAIDDGKATEHELVAAVIRHAGFLWQVSGAAYNDDAFLERAIARYERFVTLSTRAGTQPLLLSRTSTMSPTPCRGAPAMVPARVEDANVERRRLRRRELLAACSRGARRAEFATSS